ncbi:ABC transporter permease [Metabacillus sp. HB246100]
MQWWAIAKKDLRIMLKDPGAIVVLFLLPLMLITVMSFALMPVFNGGGDDVITLPIVDDDQTDQSKKFVTLLEETEGIEVISLEQADEVIKQVSNGEYAYALVIPKDFGTNMRNGEKIELLSYEDPAQANMSSIIGKAIEGVARAYEIEYIVSRMVDQQILKINDSMEEEIQKVGEAYERQMASLLSQLNTENKDIPASTTVEEEGSLPDLTEMKEELIGSAQASFDQPSITIDSSSASGKEEWTRPDAFQQNVPGYTVMYAFFIIMFAGRSFLNERNDGTFRRVLAAPIARWQLFIGKMLPNYFIGLAQVVVLFGFGHYVFDMSLGTSFLGLALVSLTLVWASSCLGMLIAALFKTDSQISGWSVLLALTLAALGGTMVPLFIMPDVMQQIALITPHAWALNGYQDLLVRGLGVESVLGNALALFGFGASFLLVALWKMKDER